MSKYTPQARAAVKSFAPYVPGRSIAEVKQKYGLKQIIKLASNENLWGTSKCAVNEIKKELDKLLGI